MSVSSLFIRGSVAGTRGRRSTFCTRPITARAAFMPVGLPCSKRAAMVSRRRLMIRSAASKSPGRGQVDHLRHHLREGIGRNRYHAVAAAAHDLDREAVVARDDAESVATVAYDLLDLGDVARRLLDGDDVGLVGSQTACGLGRHVHARATRYVVQNDGHGRSLGYGAEVAVEALLRRLVVVGRDAQYGIYAAEVGVLDILHDLGRAVASEPCHEGHASVDALLYDVEYVTALRGFNRGGLGSGAEGHDVVGPAVDDVVDKALQGLDVVREVLLERGYKGGACAAESACIHICRCRCLQLICGLK